MIFLSNVGTNCRPAKLRGIRLFFHIERFYKQSQNGKEGGWSWSEYKMWGFQKCSLQNILQSTKLTD